MRVLLCINGTSFPPTHDWGEPEQAPPRAVLPMRMREVYVHFQVQRSFEVAYARLQLRDREERGQAESHRGNRRGSVALLNWLNI